MINLNIIALPIQGQIYLNFFHAEKLFPFNFIKLGNDVGQRSFNSRYDYLKKKTSINQANLRYENPLHRRDIIEQ